MLILKKTGKSEPFDPLKLIKSMGVDLVNDVVSKCHGDTDSSDLRNHVIATFFDHHMIKEGKNYMGFIKDRWITRSVEITDTIIMANDAKILGISNHFKLLLLDNLSHPQIVVTFYKRSVGSVPGIFVGELDDIFVFKDKEVVYI